MCGAESPLDDYLVHGLLRVALTTAIVRLALGERFRPRVGLAPIAVVVSDVVGVGGVL